MPRRFIARNIKVNILEVCARPRMLILGGLWDGFNRVTRAPGFRKKSLRRGCASLNHGSTSGGAPGGGFMRFCRQQHSLAAFFTSLSGFTHMFKKKTAPRTATFVDGTHGRLSTAAAATLTFGLSSLQRRGLRGRIPGRHGGGEMSSGPSPCPRGASPPRPCFCSWRRQR
jgi:hypothetical protein